MAAALGADFLGLILAESPRRVDPEAAVSWIPEVRARHPRARWVGVLVRPRPSEIEEAVGRLSLDLVQIHGLDPQAHLECPVPWIQVLRPEWAVLCAAGSGAAAGLEKPAGPWAVLVDTPSADGGGGTGKSFDWSVLGDPVSRLREREESWARLFLAGGLGPDNVAEAVRRVRPYAVDASSRLEVSPGVKDHGLVRAFLEAARGEME